MARTKTPTPMANGPPPQARIAPLKVCRVSLDQIHADPQNVNTHNDLNLKGITRSLKEFGQVEPLVVQKSTGKVIGGNGRLEVMLALGWTECDIHEVDVDDRRAAALAVALNRPAKTSELNRDALAGLLTSLQEDDPELALVLYEDDPELEALLAELDGAALGDDEPDDDDDPDPPPADPRDSNPAAAYPLAVTLTRQQYQAWKVKKAGLGMTSDTTAFIKVAGLE